MTSLLLITGLLYGCSESQQPRMVDFRQAAYPADLVSASGISTPEAWGRWTDGSLVVLQFKKTLPSRFQLKLQTAWVSGQNAGLPISVRAGSVQKEFTVTGDNQLVVIEFDGVKKANRIELVIPKPVSPKELGLSEDARKLGLGLVSLAIEPKTGS